MELSLNHSLKPAISLRVQLPLSNFTEYILTLDGEERPFNGPTDAAAVP